MLFEINTSLPAVFIDAIDVGCTQTCFTDGSRCSCTCARALHLCSRCSCASAAALHQEKPVVVACGGRIGCKKETLPCMCMRPHVPLHPSHGGASAANLKKEEAVLRFHFRQLEFQVHFCDVVFVWRSAISQLASGGY